MNDSEAIYQCQGLITFLECADPEEVKLSVRHVSEGKPPEISLDLCLREIQRHLPNVFDYMHKNCDKISLRSFFQFVYLRLDATDRSTVKDGLVDIDLETKMLQNYVSTESTDQIEDSETELWLNETSPSVEVSPGESQQQAYVSPHGHIYTQQSLHSSEVAENLSSQAPPSWPYTHTNNFCSNESNPSVPHNWKDNYANLASIEHSWELEADNKIFEYDITPTDEMEMLLVKEDPYEPQLEIIEHEHDDTDEEYIDDLEGSGNIQNGDPKKYTERKLSSKLQRTRGTHRACDFCWGRHKKCDGGTPCTACQQRKQPCKYTRRKKKRGPKPKASTSSTARKPKRSRGELDDLDNEEEFEVIPPPTTRQKRQRTFIQDNSDYI